MNKERYEALSAEHRAIIDELAGEVFSLKGAESFDAADAKSISKMEAAPQMDKVTVVSVSDKERARWTRRSAKV